MVPAVGMRNMAVVFRMRMIMGKVMASTELQFPCDIPVPVHALCVPSINPSCNLL